MTLIGDNAYGGDWCRMPPLVWIELVPSTFCLDHVAVVDALLLVLVETLFLEYRRRLCAPDLRLYLVDSGWVVDFGWRRVVRGLHLPVVRNTG
jgi:hypothetical protein